MPALNSEEFQFGDTGVLLNSDSSLPFVDITSVEGLDNAPTRQQTHDMEGQDGGYIDSEFETMRTVTLEGTIYADPSDMEDYLDTLKANFAPTTTVQPLYFGTDKESRVVFGKSQGFRYTKDSKRRLGTADFQVQVICEDPRIYTDNLLSTTITRSQTFLQITLEGNRPSPAQLILTGSITSPTITYQNTGDVFSFSGFSLGSGNELVIDLFNHTVIEEGTTSRRRNMTITGNWFKLLPNVTSTFEFGGTGSTATLEVRARSAWR